MLRSWSLKRLVVRTSTLTAWAAVALLALAGTTSCGATSAAGAASSGATAGPPPKTSTSQLVCSLNGYGYDNPSAPVTLDVTLSTSASAMAGTAIKVRMSTTAAVLPPAVISQLIGVTTFAVKGTVAGRGMATSTVTIKGSTAGNKLASPPGHLPAITTATGPVMFLKAGTAGVYMPPTVVYTPYAGSTARPAITCHARYTVQWLISVTVTAPLRSAPACRGACTDHAGRKPSLTAGTS